MVTIALLGLAVVVACQSGDVKDDGAAGLARGHPGMNIYPAAEAGETRVLPRAYEGAPPLIPHSVVDLVIDRTVNDCLDCHLDGEELNEGHVATAVSRSHVENAYTGSKASDGVIGVRYNCLQCHVPQAVAASTLDENHK